MLVYYFIAFISAFCFSYINIYSSTRFNSFFFLFYRHWSVLVYSMFYGMAGALLLGLLREKAILIQDANLKAGAKVLQAMGTGIVTRGISDVVLFTIRHGRQEVPIGLRSITRFVDKIFENQFDAIGFARMSDFAKPFLRKYASTNADALKKRIVIELSAHPSKDKVAAFAESLAHVHTCKEVLDGLLREFGRATYKKICNVVPAGCV